MMIATPITAPIPIMVQGSWPPNMPFATDAMRFACGACERTADAPRVGTPMPYAVREQVQHRRHDQRAGDGADRQHHLLPPRRRADEVAGLEVLQVVAGDRRPRSTPRRRS